jgi:hypothetical protein
MMRAKRDRYFKMAFDTATTQERARDPVLRRVRAERFD